MRTLISLPVTAFSGVIAIANAQPVKLSLHNDVPRETVKTDQNKTTHSESSLSKTDISAARVMATGAKTFRSVADHFSDRINILDYGAKEDGITDDGPAWNAAIAVANARISSGIFSVIYDPGRGISLIKTPLIPFVGPVGIVGDGPMRSMILLDRSYSGDLFQWSDAWEASSFPFNGGTPALSTQRSGLIVHGIGVFGTRPINTHQNIFMFYDRTDFVDMSDVNVFNIDGRVLAAGIRKHANSAFIRESHFNRLRFFNCGSALSPVLDINSNSNQDGSNELRFEDVDIYGAYGTSIIIHSVAGATRGIYFNGLRVEGKENNPAGVASDMIDVGDVSERGKVLQVTFDNTSITSPYTGYAALRLAAASRASQPYDIQFRGSIVAAAGRGKGLEIDAGYLSNFDFTELSTIGTDITVGPSSLVTGPITLNGWGAERSWKYQIDPTSLSAVRILVSTRGVTGMDLDTSRDSATQFASGPNAITLGANNTASGSASLAAGSGNTASGGAAVALGYLNTAKGEGDFAAGQSNHLTGYNSIGLGVSSSDHGRNGCFNYSSGAFARAGDAQLSICLLRASISSATATQLTLNGRTPDISNALTISRGSHLHFSIAASCYDTTTSVAWASWDPLFGDLNSSMIGAITYSGGYAIATAPTRSSGTLRRATLLVEPNGSPSSLKVVINPPPKNKDELHCVSHVNGIEEIQ